MSIKGRLAKAFAENSNGNVLHFALKILGLDGGEGSGNYGHKGRPGKVGGSGPGGGKQYRGGRADIGYYGSRKDWLNGLQGEKQTKAVRAIAKHKKDLENTVKLKEKIIDLGNRGMLTFPEVEQRIKEANLDKITPNMAPEEFALRRGNPTEQKQLLDLMKESRSWDEKKDKLIDENLDENEKKTLEFLNSEDFSKYTDAQKAKEASQIKNLLEAKAMGAFESEIDVPDEIQYGAGTKERPPEPEPEPEEPEGTDYSWYDNPEYGTGGESEAATRCMLIVAGGDPSEASVYNKEKFAELNQRFVDEMKYGKPGARDISKYGIRAIRELREATTKNVQSSWGRMRGQYANTPEMISRLTDDEQKRLVDIVNTCVKKQRFQRYPEFTNLQEMSPDAFDSAELVMRNITPKSNVQMQMYKDYILLQEKMMLGITPRSEEAIKAAKSAAQSEKELERKQKEKEWHSTHTDEQIEKMYRPESIAGVSRRSEGDMSHEEANEGKVNPHRDEMDRAKRGNCQTCVIAYALRRRGYDVEAKPRREDAESYQKEIARDSEVAWFDRDTGEHPEFIELDKNKRYTAVSGKKWLEENVKEGQIHTLEFCWGSGWGAHIIIVERINGELTLYDPQASTTTAKPKHTGDEITTYLKDLSWNATARGMWRPKLLRIDNALPNPRYYDRILKKAGT